MKKVRRDKVHAPRHITLVTERVLMRLDADMCYRVRKPYINRQAKPYPCMKKVSSLDLTLTYVIVLVISLLVPA